MLADKFCSFKMIVFFKTPTGIIVVHAGNDLHTLRL